MTAILFAVFRATWREAASLSSVQGNNIFYWAALLSLQPASAALWWLVIGVLLLAPALLTPLAKIPEERWRVWPLTPWSAAGLRPFVKPTRASAPVLWKIPLLELRQIARTLDVYLAIAIAAAGVAYRFLWPSPVAAAIDAMTLLVVLSLSTLGQNLFTLDGAARVRWRLAPARGALTLWRKGRVLLGLTIALTLLLKPLAALAGMLAALAIGHHNSALAPRESPPWRFSAGRFFPHGLLQAVSCFACGIAVARGEWVFLALASFAYAASLVLYGWALEKH